MLNVIKNVSAQKDETDTETQYDRRRLARRDKVSSNLIPLLRSVAEPEILKADLVAFENPVSINHDSLSAARGIANGIVISLVLWSLFGLVGYFIFR